MRKITFALLLLPAMMFAQDMPPPGLEDPVTEADIGQRTFILLITAVILGLYFVYKKHNRPNVISLKEK